MKVGLTVLILALVILLPQSAWADSDFCPGPGNNLIDNISPNVLANLRKDAGNPNCWLTGTFLFRPNDLSSPNLADFFRAAAVNRVYPIIRIGSDNSGDDWPAITPNEAASYAGYVSQAAAGFPKTVYVELGNEINSGKEWGGQANPGSYATSFIAFADSAGSIKVMLPPLILNSAAAISPEDYYLRLKKALDQKLAAKFSCSLVDDPQEKCRGKVDSWLDNHINGYGLNLYAATGNSAGIVNDKNRAINALKAAGFNIDARDFLITEVGLPDGIYSANVGAEACKFYQALQSGSQKILAATIYSRDSQDRVHAFYYNNGNCSSTKEYRVAVVNLGGSVTYGAVSGYPSTNQIVYPPLGSIQSCPQIADSGTQTANPATSGSQSPDKWYSKDDGKECPAEPDCCSKIVPANDSYQCAAWEDRYWCRPENCVTGDGARCGAGLLTFCQRGGQKKSAAPTQSTCTPVNNTGNICNSECSPPIEIEQSLQLLRSGNCAVSGNCSAQIKIKGNKIPVPGQIRELADYFENLAPYFLSQSQQDDLRCKLIKYAKDHPNSKYKEFKDLPCDPKSVPDWNKIPLFPDDDSLGKIEFVSPGLATIKPVNVSIPDIQRLNLATKAVQAALVPATTVQPKIYGKAITVNLDSNSCQPVKTWENLYGADYDRGVACKFGNFAAVKGENNLSGCVLLPDGTLQCERTEATAGFRKYTGQEATVQVRTVFPHLYETSEQGISFLQGLLQIFRPEAVEDFKEPYYGIPAAVDGVKYELTNSSGLAINDTGHQQSGWQLFFYKIGGLWNAREFVLKMLGNRQL